MGLMKNSLLIIAQEPITERLGGLGMRQYEIARHLREDFHVVLTTPWPTSRKPKGFDIVHIPYEDLDSYQKYIRDSDIVYINSVPSSILSLLEKGGKYIIVDLCPIYVFENLEFEAFEKKISNSRIYSELDYFKKRLKTGDFFICAGIRERDYHLGILALEKKIPFHSYPNDKNFKKIIDLVPMGIPDNPPKKTEKMIRGVIEGVGENDFLLIWSGAIWNWYDTDTLLKALSLAVRKKPEIKLVFVGTTSPSSENATHRYQFETLMSLAKDLDLLGKNLFIMPGWIPYDKRQNYLLEADAAVVTFNDHIENYFSFRIRIIDYLWASLPIISTKGNIFSDLIEKEGLGEVVDFGDIEGLSEAILKMATNCDILKKYSRKLHVVRKNFFWKDMVRPIKEFCQNPRKLKRDYDNSLPVIPMSKMKLKSYGRILVLRSSAVDHAEQALENLKSLYPSSRIDIVLQPNITKVLTANGNNIRKIPYPFSHFHPDTADEFFTELLRGEEKYDLAVCTLFSSDLDYYDNVIKFLKKSRAKEIIAFTRQGVFSELGITGQGD